MADKKYWHDNRINMSFKFNQGRKKKWLRCSEDHIKGWGKRAYKKLEQLSQISTPNDEMETEIKYCEKIIMMEAVIDKLFKSTAEEYRRQTCPTDIEIVTDATEKLIKIIMEKK